MVGRLVNRWDGGGFERDGTISVTSIGQRIDNFVRSAGGRGGRQLVLLNILIATSDYTISRFN